MYGEAVKINLKKKYGLGSGLSVGEVGKKKYVIYFTPFVPT
jgi:hypothetical protein